jgi:hypothetical protein
MNAFKEEYDKSAKVAEQLLQELLEEEELTEEQKIKRK